MATHKEIVKVWIAPGCIVCDSCETDCPEVFDVQEETCVIRPAAKSGDFTKPLTPSILTAAEGCPVEVIKFETIEVEGPEPWAGKEAAAKEPAAVGAGAGGVGAKRGAPAIPEGPPNPKWAGLLATSYVSGSRSAGGPAVAVRSARAPAEAVAGALPAGAPPDALSAAMVGSGFTRPRPNVAQRIRKTADALASSAGMTRRQFNWLVGGAWLAMVAVGGTFAAALQSFMVPKVTKEPPNTFRAGKLSDYPNPGVYEQYKGTNGVWIVYLPQGQLVAISTICTHLGCIPNWLPADQKFKCPCHGSGYYMTGVNFEGPAPRPLERLKVSLEGDTIVVDKSLKFRQELGQWADPKSYIAL